MRQVTASMILPTAQEDTREPEGRDRLSVEAGGRGIVSRIPNGLSLGRMVLGLCFPWLPPSWRLPVVVVAALTDLLDGASGRFFRACSRTGRVLDPLADKVFVAAVLTTFLVEGVLTTEEIALVGLRDLTVIAGTVGGLALRKWAVFRWMEPTRLGKATTVAQVVFIVVLLVAPELKESAFVATVGLSTLASGHYLWLFLTHRLQETSDVPRP
jgi:cardiolipin synthase